MNPVTAPPVHSATMVMTVLGVPPLFFSFPLQRYKKNLRYANFVPIFGDLQKPARLPPPADFPCSFLVHPCASFLSWPFRGILSRLTVSFFAGYYPAFIFFFFRAIRLPALYVRFCGIIFGPPHGALMHRHPLYRTSCPVMVYTLPPRRMKI